MECSFSLGSQEYLKSILFYSMTQRELYFCKLVIKTFMQGSISSLQDAKVIFLNLEYLFLKCSWTDFFQEKMQDLKLSYTLQNFQSRSY